MREIKFRGKREHDGEWVYGVPIFFPDESVYLVTIGWMMLEKTAIIPDTLGQYTGLHDRHGVEIYEGDIVEIMIPSGWNGSDIETHKGYVEYDKEDASFVFGNDKTIYSLDNSKIVLGNVHENPELLD